MKRLFDTHHKTNNFTAAALLTVLLGACSVNAPLPTPVTELAPPLSAEDAEIYAEMHDVIVQHYGRYDSEILQGLAQRLAEQLTVRSQFDQMVVRVTILDTPMFNTFSHLGGYIYIGRGLVGYLNSEAELAAVIAHELSHLILDHPRRGASDKAEGGGVIVDGPFVMAVINNEDVRQRLRPLIPTFSTGYGRDLEFETLGLSAELMARAGYDPEDLLQTIGALRLYEEGARQLASKTDSIPSVYHGTLTLDPTADPSVAQSILAATHLKTDALYYVPTDNLVPLLDELTVGDGVGYRITTGKRISHKNLGITLDEPEGWSSRELVDGIVFYPPEQKAFLAIFGLEADLEQPLREFMENYFEIDNLGSALQINFSAADVLVGEGALKTVFGERKAVIGATYMGENAVVFAAVADDEEFWVENHAVLAKTLDSFRLWNDSDDDAPQPLKLKIVSAKEGATFAKLLDKRLKKQVSVDQLRLLNRLYPAGEPSPEQVIKTITQ